jgi:flagellar biosynthesis protein FlhF
LADDKTALEAMARQIQAKLAGQRSGAQSPAENFEPDWARSERDFDAVASTFQRAPPKENRRQIEQNDEVIVPNEAWKPLRPNWRNAPREAVVNPSPRPVRPQQLAPTPSVTKQVATPPSRAQAQNAAPPSQPQRPQPRAEQSAPAPQVRLSSRDRQIAQALEFHSIPRPIAEALFRAAKAIDSDDATIALSGALESRLVFAPLSPTPRRPMMMIGPVGAGKTVSVAKIAAKAVLTGKRVDVITTDTVRAGAIAQIESYTNVLEQDLGIEETPDGLNERLSLMHDGQAVVIDTAGANPFLTHEMTDLALFMAAVPGVDPVLALPAGGDAREALEIAQAFRALGAKKLIITRVDAARRLGALVAAADAGLTLAQISNSPYVAEGLAPINATSLAGLLLSPLAPAINDLSLEAAYP